MRSGLRLGAEGSEGGGRLPQSLARLGDAAASPRFGWTFWIAALAALSWLWVAHHWISDDAFITFRSIEQLFAGNGLRFNVHERVQSFTHPLWLALLLAPRALGMALPDAARLVSLLLVAGAFSFLWWTTRARPARWIFAAAVAIGSRTLFDFTGSGLETPLTLLLVFLFAHAVLRRDEPPAAAGSALAVYLAAALLLLTRLDHAPLLAPALAWVLWRRRRADRRGWLGELVVGFSPLLVWLLFAFLYFGSPFPNTALAKLGAGVSRSELLVQGAIYFAVTARWDLLLVPLLVAGGAIAWRGGPAERALAAGAALHLLYVLSVGGDFMAGRFLLPAAALVLAVATWRAPSELLVAGTAAALVVAAVVPGGAFDAEGRFREGWGRTESGKSGIVDYKPYAAGYMQRHAAAKPIVPMSEPLGPPRRVGKLGVEGYRAHERQILIDEFALSDPFLARLPYDPPWRIGHFQRWLPDGYLESVSTGANRIADPALAALYDEVRFVSSGPVFDPRRIVLSVRLLFRREPILIPPRCPGLTVAKAGTGTAGVDGRELLGATWTTAGSRLVLRGTAPLGEQARHWQLRIEVDPLPATSALRCLHEAHLAQLGIEAELEFASEAQARAAAANAPSSRLVRARTEASPP